MDRKLGLRTLDGFERGLLIGLKFEVELRVSECIEKWTGSTCLTQPSVSLIISVAVSLPAASAVQVTESAPSVCPSVSQFSVADKGSTF